MTIEMIILSALLTNSWVLLKSISFYVEINGGVPLVACRHQRSYYIFSLHLTLSAEGESALSLR